MSLSKTKIKYVQSLKQKKFRDEYNVFIAEGDKIISDLLPMMKCELLIASKDYTDFIKDKEYQIDEIIEVSRDDLERVSFQKTPQHSLGIFYKPQYTLNQSELSNQLVLALDGIQDPGNMGTIIRLADWYGIENIVCSEDTVDVYNPKVVQATMGALARIKVHYVELGNWLELQKEIPIYGAFLDGQNIYKTGISETGIIVMGNEGNGIRPMVEKHVTDKIYIPNYPEGRATSESLNVGVATAIICNEFRRQFMLKQ